MLHGEKRLKLSCGGQRLVLCAYDYIAGLESRSVRCTILSDLRHQNAALGLKRGGQLRRELACRESRLKPRVRSKGSAAEVGERVRLPGRRRRIWVPRAKRPNAFEDLPQLEI